MSEGILIGTVDEIWTHSSATRALRTWRQCITAIQRLSDHGQGIFSSWVKAIVMQDAAGMAPFALDEIAEFIVQNPEARVYWQSVLVDDRFPHRCPHCKVSAAFIGFNQVECKSRCRR